MYVDVLTVGGIGLVLYMAVDSLRPGRDVWPLRIIRYSFGLYLVYVLHYTLGSVRLGPPGALWEIWNASTQLVPFQFLEYTRHLYRVHGMDIRVLQSVRLSFYNLLLLMPLGFYIPAVRGRDRLRAVMGTAFFLSLTIETAQLLLTAGGWIRPRTFNVDDLILNTAGAALGWLLYRLMARRTVQRMLERWNQEG